MITLLESRGHAVSLVHDGADDVDGANRLCVSDVWSISETGLDNALASVRAWGPDVCYSHNMRRLEVDERLADEWPTVKMMHGYFGYLRQRAKGFLVSACSSVRAPVRPGVSRPLPAPPLRLPRSLRDDVAVRLGRAAASVVRSLRRHRRCERSHAEGIPGPRRSARSHAHDPAVCGHDAASTSGDPIDVIFLGRLTRLKGCGPLVQAVRRASDRMGRVVTLTIAGEGPERQSLERLAASLDVRATFPGWVDDRGKADLLSRSAVLAIPSLWPEPFGLVGLEAAAFGVPAVGFDVGGISTWLSNDVNGRLVSTAAGVDGLAGCPRGRSCVMRSVPCTAVVWRAAAPRVALPPTRTSHRSSACWSPLDVNGAL